MPHEPSRPTTVRARVFGIGAALLGAVCCCSTEPDDDGPEVTAGSEAVFGDNPADVLIKRDDFEGYDHLHSDEGTPSIFGTGAYWIMDYAYPGGFMDHVQLDVTGGKGNSKALKLNYGEGGGYELDVYKRFGEAKGHFFYQTWFKTTPGWDLTSWETQDGYGGIKGWMFFDGSARAQWGVGRQLTDQTTCETSDWPYSDIALFGGGGYGRRSIPSGGCDSFTWSGRADDYSAPPWFGEDGTDFPRSNAFNNGSYHRITFEHKSVGCPQYKKVWVDGILVWDDSDQGLTYPAIDAVKFWGNYSMGINYFTTANPDPGSIWLDEIIMWER